MEITKKINGKSFEIDFDGSCAFMQGKFKYKYEGGGNSDPAYLEVEFQQLGEVKVEGQKVKINFFGPGEVSDFIEFCEEVARLNKPLD